MAFTVDHKGPPRRRFFASIRRESDDRFWSAHSGWIGAVAIVPLPEQAVGQYSTRVTDTAKGEAYQVAVVQAPYAVLKHYRCGSKGEPVTAATAGKGKQVNATFVGGILHVDGKEQEVDIVLHTRSKTSGALYATIKWGPSGITSCDCPGWTTSVAHRGKPLQERSCKHTKKVAVMKESILLDGSSNLLPKKSTPVTNTERSGRGIELD